MHPQDPRRHPNHPEHTHATPRRVGPQHRIAERDVNPSGSGGNQRHDGPACDHPIPDELSKE